MDTVYWISLIVGGFLFGSIMFSQWLPMLIKKKDIYSISADNNPGGFNACKHCGILFGALCIFLDGFKGLVPVLIASLLMDTQNFAFVLVMIAPMLGHAVGLFNRFHGGKCISTSFGIFLGLIPVTPIPIIVLAALFVSMTVLKIIKNAAIRSVVVYLLFEIITCTILFIMQMPVTAVGCLAVGLIPIVKFLFSKKGLVDNKYRDPIGDKRNS